MTKYNNLKYAMGNHYRLYDKKGMDSPTTAVWILLPNKRMYITNNKTTEFYEINSPLGNTTKEE